MPPRKTPDVDPSERIASALDAAAEASERYVEARSALLHRLAEIDTAVVELVERVYDATPAEYQRTFLVRADAAGEEEMTLPDFLRYLMERPGGTTATFRIAVADDLYDEDGEEDED
jgi:hypothetical protein